MTPIGDEREDLECRHVLAHETSLSRTMYAKHCFKLSLESIFS